MRRQLAARVAVVVTAAVVTATCTGGAPPPGDDRPTGRSRGGVLEVEATALGFDRNLDPTAEYTSFGFALFSNLLLRPLMNYPHVGGRAGNEVVPDLASGMPEISSDGLTYTFDLRKGVRFGPPVDREITSADVLYAFERMANEAVEPQYAFYFDTSIEGFTEYRTGSASSISGIETPDDDTIVFRLLKPTGDFLYRIAMRAAAPIPREVARCFGRRGAYGYRLIASGPYMIEGSEDLDIGACSTMERLSGFVPDRSLSLVRNPNHDPRTDDPKIREARLEGVRITVERDSEATIERIEAGEVDLATAAPSLDVLRRYAEQGELRDNLHVEGGDRIWYITMNLLIPPFDDVHVRRAVNLVMDKDSILRAWGGPLEGHIATHVLPDGMLNGMLEDYDPYPSPNHAGDVRAALREMARSAYDRNGDGLCDRPECDGVLHVSRPATPWAQMAPVIEASLAKIGISLDTRNYTDPYDLLQEVPTKAAISSIPGWFKDYPDAFSFIGFLFDGRNIQPGTTTNYSYVGMSAEQAAELGIDYPEEGVPSIDADIDRCTAILDDDDRRACWAEVDRKLMEEVVPWVPYLDATHLIVTSDAVIDYEYDQFSGELSFAHVGIDRSR